MSDLFVSLVDNATIRIGCEAGIAQELNEHFTFLVPGYKFMPAYRNGIWDGKIKLFNKLTGELLAGLFPYVQKFADARGYTMEVVESDFGVPNQVFPIDQEFLDQFYQSLKLPYTVRDYQNDAVKHALERRRALLISPTGSGKSLIAYLLTRFILGSTRGKVLIVVPTTGLVTQLLSDFKDYGFNTADKVHVIYSGKDKKTDRRVVITTWQSVYKLNKSWFDQFDAVIGDEAHGFKAKSLTSIMNKSTEAKYRIGLTGTLDGTQTHKLVLEGLFGIEKQVTKTKELQDRGELSKVMIRIAVLKYSTASVDRFYEQKRDQDYKREIDFLVEHPLRNNFIANLSINCKGNTLVLFRFEDHGRTLYDLIRTRVAEDRKVFFIAGTVDVDDREAIRRLVEKIDGAIIVASMGTFSTGINIRNLHNIIFSTPSKARIKVLQSIGRGLRISDNGWDTNIFDVFDDLTNPMTDLPNTTLRHGAERLKLYKAEQFPFKIIKVDIP